MIVEHVYGSSVIAACGGHERFVYTLCKRLAEHGIKVVILHTGKTSKNNNIIFAKIHSTRIANRFFMPMNLRRFVSLLKLGDVIHVHSPSNPFAFIAVILAKLLGKPVVCTVLCYLADLFHHKFIMKLLSPLTITLETFAALLADVIHVENIRDYVLVRKITKKLTVYAEPWLNAKELNSNEDNNNYNGGQSCTILYIGRIDPAKGVHLLIEAMNYLPRGTKLIIAGALQDYKYYCKLLDLRARLNLKERVHIIGSIDEQFKHKLYKFCKIVAIPSMSDIVEAYSIVATEAWSHGKPVVAFPVGALRYRVKDGVNGFLARRRDPRSLAEVILRALKLENIPEYQSQFDTVRVFVVLYRWLAAIRSDSGG